ncbi:MAG: sulfite exporter TauE/SafE family protein [Calditrichaceae bacterium]
MNIDLSGAFLIGLLGSFSHCIGMCGGFIMAYSLKLPPLNLSSGSFRNRLNNLFPHLLYNSGRILTYTFLGEVFGLLGSTIGVVLAIRDFQGILQIFAGVVMLLMGLDLAGILRGFSPESFPGFGYFRKLVDYLLNRLDRKNVFVLGIVLGFIPCGLVYSVGAAAAATGSVWKGALVMMVFGIGTMPALILIGLTANLFSAKLKHRMFRLAALIVVLLGALTFLRGIDSMGWVHLYWLSKL